MNKTLIIGFVLCTSLTIAHTLHGQRSMEVGGWLGVSYFYGDINSGISLLDPSVGGGFVFRYNFNPRINLKAGINVTSLTANDKDSNNDFERARNLSFSSSIREIIVQWDFNFLPYEHGHVENWYTPYVFLGASVFRFNPRANFQGQSVELAELGTEGQLPGDEYSRIQPAIVYGLGYKFDISRKWSMNVELSNRLTFTDYIDDVSGTYPNMVELASVRGPLAPQLSDRSIEILNTFGLGEEGKQRGNSQRSDSFHMIGISLLYTITWLDCPKISRP